MPIKSVMPSSHLILCHPLLLLPPIPPSIWVFSNESTLHIWWPKYWSFSLSISPSKEHPGLISFRMDWLDLLAVQGTLKSLLQHHSSKASIFRHSAFFTVQLSHPYMSTGKTIAWTRWTFVGKVLSLLFNIAALNKGSLWGFPGGTVVKNLPARAGDAGVMCSIPGSRSFPGVGNGNPLQYSCLEDSMDREVWQSAIHEVAKSQTQLSTSTHNHRIPNDGLFFTIYFYFWLLWVFVTACRLSLVAESRGYSLAVVCGLLIAVASLVLEHVL